MDPWIRQGVPFLRNGFVRFGNFFIFRSLSPYGVLNSVHKLTVTYYGEITIEPILTPEFDVDHDFEVKNGCFQSLFPRFRVISAYSTGRASHSDHFSGQVSMATILQDFYLFRRGFHLGVRDHLPDEGCADCTGHVVPGARPCALGTFSYLVSSTSYFRLSYPNRLL